MSEKVRQHSREGSEDTRVDSIGGAEVARNGARAADRNDEANAPGPDSEDGSPDDGDDSEMERRHSAVQELARRYTSERSASNPGNLEDVVAGQDPDSPLNPASEKFSARAWAKSLADLTSQHGSGFRKSGFSFQNMHVFGYGSATDYQKDVGNVWNEIPNLARRFTKSGGTRRIDILRGLDGVVKPGEMLVVLGPPGAGCSTYLKSIAGETNGIYIDESTKLNYHGISEKEYHTHHSGEAIYTAEVDEHFPMLSVGETLTFAANARSPRILPGGVKRSDFSNHHRDVVMAMYGISHTVNTRVGDHYIRGVSGGERKRVTIAEATLSSAPLQCWDNSTRGLDSANAIEFCKTLRLQSDLFGQTSAVSIYQAPQSAYDLFDKVLVLYEGRQIFFGAADAAKDYFVNLGFECPARQTRPDFLTSMTAPSERIVRPGWEGRAPRTPDEFAARWKSSKEYQILQAEIEQYNNDHPVNGPDADAFRAHKQLTQAKGQRVKSPFTLSYAQQVALCVWRGWRRLIGSPGLTIFSILANTIMNLVISSLFYDMQMTTASFFQRGAVLFVAILMSAFSSALEILTQYSQRPIVEKHRRYGFYHASAEAFASVLVDMPYKVANTICTNLIMYFMTNLKREPGAFFFFFFVSFIMVLSMSGVFRSM